MINLYNRDCLEAMREMPDNAFDLAIVDPPYGLKESGAQSGGKNSMSDRAYHNGIIDRWDIKPSQDYFNELFRVSKNQIIWGGNYFDLHPTRCFICWDKMQPWDTFSKCEYAWTSFSSPANLYRFDNRYSGKIHPTQKPVALYTWLLDKYAKKGDRILDTHLGSGSIAIACHNLGYSLDGYELDKDYYNAACNRLRDHQDQLLLFR